MARPSAAIYPLMALLFLTTNFICVYVIAVAKGDVYPIWPYISDCAALYPQSSIFAMLLDIAAALIVCTTYLRRKRILLIIGDARAAAAVAAVAAAAVDVNVAPIRPHRRLKTANNVEFICSLIAVTGFIMVGNFQEFLWGDIHYLAVLILAFGGGLYTLIDTIITWVLLRTESYSKWTIVIFRICVVCFAWIVAIISIAGREISHRAWEEHFSNQTRRDRYSAQLHWTETDPAYRWHLASTITEWLAGLMIIFYLGSFVDEFIEFSGSVQVILHVPPMITPPDEPDSGPFSSYPSQPVASLTDTHIAGNPATAAATML